MPKVADLSERITLQSLSQSLDTTGDEVQDWTTYWEAWAEAIVRGQREAYLTPEVQASQVVTFRIRVPPMDVLPQHRVLWNGRTLDILGTEPEPTRTWLTIISLERRVGAPAA